MDQVNWWIVVAIAVLALKAGEWGGRYKRELEIVAEERWRKAVNDRLDQLYEMLHETRHTLQRAVASPAARESELRIISELQRLRSSLTDQDRPDQ